MPSDFAKNELFLGPGQTTSHQNRLEALPENRRALSSPWGRPFAKLAIALFPGPITPPSPGGMPLQKLARAALPLLLLRKIGGNCLSQVMPTIGPPSRISQNCSWALDKRQASRNRFRGTTPHSSPMASNLCGFQGVRRCHAAWRLRYRR